MLNVRLCRLSGLISVFLLAFVFIFGFTAEIQADDGKFEGTTISKMPGKATTMKDGKIVIEVWDYSRSPECIEWRQAEFDKFAAENNCIIDFVQISWAKGEDKLKTAVAGGNWPDVAGSALSIVFVRKGAVEPINDYLTEEDKNDFLPTVLNRGFSFQGRIWAWPSYVQMYCLVLNLDLFEKLGVEPPKNGLWDWKEFVQKAKALTQDVNGDGEIDYYGLRWSIDKNTGEGWGFIHSQGADFLNEDQTACAFNNRAGFGGLQLLRNLELKFKVCPPESPYYKAPDTWLSFSTDQNCAITSQGSWSINNLRRINDGLRKKEKRYVDAGNKPMNFTIARYPVGQDGVARTNSAGFGNWTVFRQADEKKRTLCMKLARQLTSAEAQRVYIPLYGQFPTRKSCLDIYKDDYEYQVIIDSMGNNMENVYVPPLHPGWFDINEKVTVIFQNALAGKKEITEALQEACDVTEEILRQYAAGER